MRDCTHGMPTPASCIDCLPKRLRDKIAVQENGCWCWTAAIGDHGYGMAWDGEGMMGAHRLVWQLLVGPIPAGLQLDHVRERGCAHRHCVRPAHLEPVTPAENVRRAMRPACKQGHLWTPENTYRRPDNGTRQCRACHDERQRARQR